VTLALETLAAQDPDAVEILRLLCCLGSGATPRQQLTDISMIMILPGPILSTASTPSGRPATI